MPDRDSKLRIIVLGYIVRGPIGGMAWHYLNYVLGLARMGHDVLFVEDSDDYASCYNPSDHSVTADPSYGLQFIADAFNRLGLGPRWAYYDAHQDAWHGIGAADFDTFANSADLLINVSGVNPVRDWMDTVPRRVLIDTDPAFTQVRHLQDDAARHRAEAHTDFLSFGECIGQDDCSIPDDGFPWHPTRQPIVLDEWQAQSPPEGAAFSTVMQWDSYEVLAHDGQEFAMKSKSFQPLFDLPQRTDAPVEIALGSPSAPREELARAGWNLVDPLAVTLTPWSYRDYIAGSAGEFSVAKQGYVTSRGGWFSERSACYLASGRPVILQDTGFSSVLPTGDGLHAYDDSDGAVSALERCWSDPEGQQTAAREIARECFDAPKVLTDLIESLVHA
jgi:hypothetical protein